MSKRPCRKEIILASSSLGRIFLHSFSTVKARTVAFIGPRLKVLSKVSLRGSKLILAWAGLVGWADRVGPRREGVGPRRGRVGFLPLA